MCTDCLSTCSTGISVFLWSVHCRTVTEDQLLLTGKNNYHHNYLPTLSWELGSQDKLCTENYFKLFKRIQLEFLCNYKEILTLTYFTG